MTLINYGAINKLSNFLLCNGVVINNHISLLCIKIRFGFCVVIALQFSGRGLDLEGPFANDLYRGLLRQGATLVVVYVMNDVFQMLIMLCI